MSTQSPPANAMGEFAFYSWVQRGLAAALASASGSAGATGSAPTAGDDPARASVAVDVNANATPVGSQSSPSAVSATASVSLYGPGDVASLSPANVIRTEPVDGTANFEPNYLAGIEFDQPDLPFMLSAGQTNNQVAPWIVLIVLAAGEFDGPKQGAGQLPYINVHASSALQDLTEAWAWAHAQLAQPPDSQPTTLADAITNHPELVSSRLLCPRQLAPNTAYTAFVVPTFQVGVQAGLGQQPSGSQLGWAWDSTTTFPLQLPFYYSFSFQTSDAGDFESLVRRMQPRQMPPSVGLRPMDVSNPDLNWAVGPAAASPLGIGGSLRSVQTIDMVWPVAADPDGANFQNDLTALLDVSSPPADNPAAPNPTDPPVNPPMYGRWLAAQTAVPGSGWVAEVNLDPRRRVAAGLGTQIVVNERSQLMASAWSQLAGIQKANQLLRQAQLARSALDQTFAKHFKTAPTDTLLMLSAAVQPRVLAGPQTVAATIAASCLPPLALSAALRRLAAPLGPLRRRQGFGIASPYALLSALNAGTISAAPALTGPGATPQQGPGGLESLDYIIDSLPGLAPLQLAPMKFANLAAWLIGASPKGPEQIAFREAAGQLMTNLQSSDPNPSPPSGAPLGALQAALLAALDPEVTVLARTAARVSVGPAAGWSYAGDPLEPVMAAPNFPQPMVVPLKALSQDWLLPNVSQVPPDTMTVLVTDQAFVESHMVGLNHEMGRQLLWNGFPTDQRETYFRQFWPVDSNVIGSAVTIAPSVPQEDQYDISPITGWTVGSGLGTHGRFVTTQASGGASGADSAPPDWQTGNVVLLVRGELLRRYPTAVIYACPAVGPQANPTLDTDTAHEVYPAYRGTLEPDLTYFGFPLTVEEALGGPNSAYAPNGVFFVFQQLPGEPRFGLESSPVSPVEQWADLSWANFGNPAFLSPGQTPTNTATGNAGSSGTLVIPQVVTDANNVAINPNDPANSWGVDAAETAYITMRLPARVAVLASTMLGPLLPPTVTAVAPASGPIAGGTTVVISGSGFTEATTVQFGQVDAPGIQVDKDTLITVVSPAGASGVVDVTVITPSFTSATGPADQFTYEPIPAVTTVTPNSGPLAGGTSVTITGTGFTSATTVGFGATAAASSTVVSSTSITATSPASPSSGTVDITVTTAGGTSPTVTADLFTYQ
jgi:IPT/TIG domain